MYYFKLTTRTRYYDYDSLEGSNKNLIVRKLYTKDYFYVKNVIQVIHEQRLKTT